MPGKNKGFLPKDDFKNILRKMPIPCIDIIIESYGNVLFCKRRNAPYRNKWSFVGGRIFKGEGIEQSIRRILKDEIGISAKGTRARLVNVYSPRFKTMNSRHDIILCYTLSLPLRHSDIKIDEKQFSEFLLSKKPPSGLQGVHRRQYDDCKSRTVCPNQTISL
jgi:ADP-ribose pyrophosphatase YjhB (NUDIX family)